MIDTGFTGFLLMPIMSAFPLGLTLLGTGNYTLADNSTNAKLLALGNIVIEDEDPVHGVIVLEPNQCGLLLGMEFLRRAGRTLAVSTKGVVLIDEATVAELMATVQPPPRTPAGGEDKPQATQAPQEAAPDGSEL